MIKGDLIFLDTETTGLDPRLDEIWELAAIRRNADGREDKLHMQIDHDEHRIKALPEKFQADHAKRFTPELAIPRTEAVEEILAFMEGRPHIVGANIAFDARMIEEMLWLFGQHQPPWHYHLIDVETYSLGAMVHSDNFQLPWKSDAISERIGVPTTDLDGYALYDRHTAMGDAMWVRDWFDAAER